MGSRGAVVIKINGDAQSFNNELKTVEKETRALSDSLGKTAVASAAGFAVLTTAIGASVLEYREGLKVSRSVEQTIRATGGAAGVTAEDVERLSLSLQKVTNFGDETISTAQGILLTFTNLKKDVFPQVTELALDMSEKFGGVEAASEFLGKALNNPIKGMALLGKQGIIFSADQKQVITDLVHTGQVAEAQSLIYEKLQSRYGGQARAQADNISQLGEVTGDVVQLFGSTFFPVFDKAAGVLKNFGFYLIETNPELVKMAAYAIGGTTAILGVTAALTAGALIYLKVTAIWAAYSASAGIAATASGVLAGAFTLLGRAVTLATGPIGLIVTALGLIGYAVYKNFDELKAFFTGAIAGFRAFTQEVTAMLAPVGKLLSGLLLADLGKIREGFAETAKVFSENGSKAGVAFTEAYNKSMEESKLAHMEAETEPNSEKLDPSAKRDELLKEAEFEYEVEKQKKTDKLDLEKQFNEELAAIKDESGQLDVNREGFFATERARADLDEKKRRLQDEAKFGKQYSDAKAFWRNAEVQGTQEMFGNLSTLTRSKNKELFAIGKAAAIANAVVSTAQGVTRTLGEYAFPFNVAFAAAVAAAGAVQIATISGQTLNAASGFSGSGSPFGESMISTFTPREIVVPERFAEGIKRGEFSLASAKDQQAAGGGEFTVRIELTEDAAEIIEAKNIENRRINIGRG